MYLKSATSQSLRIFIAGNVASGKTTLARTLAKKTALPLIHVDNIQFNPDLSMKPFKETIENLRQIQGQESWIIDGYGPLDLIHSRLDRADLIVFLDPPYGFNLAHLYLRQLQNLWSPRKELPPGSSEISWKHTQKLVKSFKSAHQRMRPEMLRLLSRPETKGKVILINRYPTSEDVESILRVLLTK